MDLILSYCNHIEESQKLIDEIEKELSILQNRLLNEKNEQRILILNKYIYFAKRKLLNAKTLLASDKKVLQYLQNRGVIKWKKE